MDELLKFENEVKEMETADIILILQDQLDLYSEEEINILKAELSNRSTNDSDIRASKERIAREYENNYDRYLEEQLLEEQELQKKEIEKLNAIKISKINPLIQNGYDSYYEYKYLSAVDKKDGTFDINIIIARINELALEGWRLKTTLVNELGKSSLQIGFGGASSGANATIEQTIFILERKRDISKSLSN